jgi:CRP/FNR family transcriptional regulator
MESGTEIFLQSVRAVCPNLSSAELSEFASKITLTTLNKKDIFLQAGKVQKAIGFITTGLVRSFFIDDSGVEITVGFYAEGEYVTHYPAFITQSPSRYSIQSLENTEMILLFFDDMQWIYQQLQGFERYGRLIAEEILKRQQARIESFIFQTAEQRYLDFIKYQPNLFNRISLSLLCSYLGIERQTLTRIRQKLAHK